MINKIIIYISDSNDKQLVFIIFQTINKFYKYFSVRDPSMMNLRRSVLSSTMVGCRRAYASNISIAPAKSTNTELSTVAAIDLEDGALA